MLFFLLFSILIAFLCIGKDKKSQVIITITILSILCFLCMFRGESVCVDTAHYIDGFKSGDLGNRYGLLYSWLYRLCVLAGGGPHMFLALMAIITYVPLIYLSKKVDSPSAFLLLFIACPAFFLETFNLIRQTAAMSFSLLSYYFVDNDKKLKAGIMFVIASFCHSISIIFLPFYFLVKLKVPQKLMYLFLFGSLLVGLVLSMDLFYDTMDEVVQYMMLMPIFNNGISTGDIISHYVESEELTGEWGIVGILTNTLPLTMLCATSYSNSDGEKNHMALYNFFFFGTVLGNLFGSSAFNARIASPLTIACLLYVAYIYDKVSFKQKRWIKIAFLIMIVVFVRKLWGYYIDVHSLGIIPYSFCF